MSLQLLISTYLDDAPARAQQAELEAKNDEINNMIKQNELDTQQAFRKAMGAMRASYTMVSGLSQVMGGSMSQAFSAIFGMALGAIETTTSIAAALAASGPAGWVQAGLMFASLITASIQLVAVMGGQKDLSQQLGGLTMSINGISGMIGVIGF